MKRFFLLTILLIVACERQQMFEDVDYYIGDDIINSSGIAIQDYFILEFNDGIVEFIEGRYDSKSSKGWYEKQYYPFPMENTIENIPRYPDKQTGTYVREGDKITIEGLVATDDVWEKRIEFTHADIRGEDSGCLNLDVYYVSTKEQVETTGKINFIGKEY